MDIHRVIIRPIVTEKSMREAKEGKFTFQVATHVSKPVIARALEQAFGIHVVDVATHIMKGKSKRVGSRRTTKRQSPWKKAGVKVRKGETISVFNTGENK